MASPSPVQPSFDDLSPPLYEVTFCVIDLETTGGSPASCEITEIGAVKYRHGDELGVFHTLVDPGMAIPPSITILTGITHAMVVSAPRIGQVLPSLLEFIGDSVLVGHNLRFDVSFLDAAATRNGYSRLGNDTVDTAALARRLIRDEVRNLRLQTLARHLRSPIPPIHRALEDARATAHVFHALLERAGTIGVTNRDDLLALPRAKGSPHYSKIRLTDELPTRPGVYLFRDRDGRVIYVGKASNLRTRVRQYFYGDRRRSVATLMRELDAVDHVVCSTTLEAEVTELRLIHAHRPRHNRRSRPAKATHWVKLTGDAFPRLSVVRTLRPDGLAHLGPFRTKKAADRVVAALWEATPIRRCSGRPGTRSSRCAPAQMGVALCPCDGELAPAQYREVVERVLAGIATDPELLLEPLRSRMERLAAEKRYEEAAATRDRHTALAVALDRQRTWHALVGLGWCQLEDGEGTNVVLDHGRFVSAWRAGTHPPLTPVPDHDADPDPGVPSSLVAAEEARLVWAWIEGRHDLRLVEATGSLALPARPVVRLAAGT